MKKNSRTKKCAKALYLIGNLEQMFVYLDNLVEYGLLTEEEENQMAEEITNECALITMAELKELRSKF